MTAPMSPRPGVLADLRGLPRTCAQFAVEAVRWMLLAPIARDRLRLTGHSAGARALAVVAIVLSVVVVAMIPAAAILRSLGDLAIVTTAGSVLSVPRSLIWVIVLAVCVFIALLQAAALHSALWFRIATWCAVSLMLLFIGSIDASDGVSVGIWVALGAIVALTVLEIIRWRADPAWWEPLAILAVIVTVFSVVYLRAARTAQELGLDRSPLLTAAVIQQFRFLAIPIAIFAGVAVAKVALSGVTLLSDFSVRRFSPPVVAVLTLSVLGWRLVSLLRATIAELGLDKDTALRHLGGATLTVAVVVTIWGVTHHLLDLADARAGRADDDDAPVPRSATTVEAMVDRLDDVALPVAIVLAILVIPTFLATLGNQIISNLWGSQTWLALRLDEVIDAVVNDGAVRGTRLAAAVAFIAVGLLLGHRGRRGVAELTAIIGAVVLMQYLTAERGLLPGWTVAPHVIDRIGVVTAAIAAVGWTWRRAFSTDRQSVVLLLVLTSSLMGERDVLSSPITALISTSGIALVLFGFVWTFVADAGKTAEASPGFPLESRLLLFLAQTLFGLTVLAWVAVTRDPASALELSAGSELGDALLGDSLVIAVYLTVLMGALRTDDLAGGAVRAEWQKLR